MNSVNEGVSEVVNEINSPSEMRKTVKINGYDFDVFIDTGSTITLIRKVFIKFLKDRRGRNANKTSDSDENQALAKEKNELLRQIDVLNPIILDTK
ncbi:hypothetical protein TNCV_2102721 [Trichonephila clavipes]|nr:hypothetical protein TNCV_2102721 [Trichonephila clavipes]